MKRSSTAVSRRTSASSSKRSSEPSSGSAAGTYGISVDSGEAIPDARLEALPTVERTLAEQQALDG